MINGIERIIIPYRGNRNPQTIGLNEFVQKPDRGANCQTTAVGILDRLGYRIQHTISLELLHDEDETATIHNFSELKPHDIIIYLPSDGRTDPRFGHPTVAHFEGQTLYLAHNAAKNGRTVIESARHEDQGRIAAIKRPIARPKAPDVQFLTRVGLQTLVVFP